MKALKFKVDGRSVVRDNYKLFEKEFKKKLSEDVKANGINPLEESELERSQKTVWNDFKQKNKSRMTKNQKNSRQEKI